MQNMNNNIDYHRNQIADTRLYRPAEGAKLVHWFGSVQPPKEWEKAHVGIRLCTGTPIKKVERQRWIMHYCDSESEENELTFEELSKLTGESITADNWKQYVSKEKWDEYSNICTIPEPEPVDAKECVNKAVEPIDSCLVTLYSKTDDSRVTMYGHSGSDNASLVYFRKCQDGYRALCVEPYARLHIWSNCELTEERILQNYQSDTDNSIYDRLLSEEEVAYFMNQYIEWDRERNSLGKPIKMIQYCRMDTRMGELELEETENKAFCEKVGECIRLLAVKGIAPVQNRIKITYPQTEMVPILREIGDDHRAKNYLCLYQGKEMVYRELYNPIIPADELYEETKYKIDAGKFPGEWSIACTECAEGKFGYIHDYIEEQDRNSGFHSINARILACRNAVKIYGTLHTKGFCFQHATGMRNFKVDYKNGDMRLTTVDEILRCGKYHGIGRNSKETAPELYWNSLPSTIEGDRHSLAVLIFEILFDRYPFEGEKMFNQVLTDEMNGLKAPDYMMNAFRYSFSNDVLHQSNGKKRISEKEWFSLLKQWWNELVIAKR